MVTRNFWTTRIENAWSKRSVVWLRGVRRAGKTTLALSLPDVEYVDCEIPRLRQAMEDPESFLQWANSAGRRLALDEVHRLPNPSELLKIAADHFLRLKILATGSSTLGASSRFRDTVTEADLRAFGCSDLEHRFEWRPASVFSFRKSARGRNPGMDGCLLGQRYPGSLSVGAAYVFSTFFELLLAQTVGLFEATKFAAPCEVSRSTIHNYLGVLEATGVALVLRPFSSRPSAEIISAPKVYGFDTGFVCTYRGADKSAP
jgi:predicted AAA+ superfamily ATPase